MNRYTWFFNQGQIKDQCGEVALKKIFAEIQKELSLFSALTFYTEMQSPLTWGAQDCDGLTLTHNEKENVFTSPDPSSAGFCSPVAFCTEDNFWINKFFFHSYILLRGICISLNNWHFPFWTQMLLRNWRLNPRAICYMSMAIIKECYWLRTNSLQKYALPLCKNLKGWQRMCVGLRTFYSDFIFILKVGNW